MARSRHCRSGVVRWRLLGRPRRSRSALGRYAGARKAVATLRSVGLARASCAGWSAGLPCVALILPAAAIPAKSAELLEDNSFLRVTIGGRIYRLEALTVRRAEATGRLPVALIADGKPANPQGMLDDHAVNFTGAAREPRMARRRRHPPRLRAVGRPDAGAGQLPTSNSTARRDAARLRGAASIDCA
jgi:hypothetical protein